MELLRSDVRGDRSRLEALLDDFVEIGASGRVWQREAIVADLLTSPVAEVTVVDMTARHVDERMVLVTYTTIASDRRVLRSSWWRWTGNDWKCCFHQGTVVPNSEPAQLSAE